MPGDYIHLVDPGLRDLVPRLAAFEAQFTPLTRDNLPAMREAYLATAVPPLNDVAVSIEKIARDAGEEKLELFVINAHAGRDRPAILHVHGGGFVMGGVRIDLAQLQAIARELDVVIVSAEYRLAPETDWRGSLADNYAALAWLHRNASALGANPEKIAVTGESAGGGHAALLSIAARDRREIPIGFQCLVYPMLDDRTGSSIERAPQLGWVGWPAAWNRFGWECLLGGPAGGTETHPGVPGRCGDLSGLPPTWIGVGDLDLFVDENIEFAGRLIGAAVPVELHVIPGGFHGFDEATRGLDPRPRISVDFENARLDALRRWARA